MFSVGTLPSSVPMPWVCYEKDVTKRQRSERESKPPRRPPPLHQLTLEESIARLGLRGVTSKRMFGGLCYYAESKAFSFVLADYLALKLPAKQLRAGCAQGDGQLFNPGGGDFIMREYMALSDQTLADEERLDVYVLASYRFIAGQETAEEDLAFTDLWQGRGGLYRQTKRKHER